MIKLKQLSIKRISILGLFLSILITLKYVFGFIPGIECVSFLFIVFGIFLPMLDLTLLVISFNILVMVVYGFGTWWIMYWIIFPVDAFLSKGLSKITRNKYIFAGWGFIAGASVAFWYYLSDVFFYGNSFAALNIITAIPINAIEGFTTMLLIILIAPRILDVVSIYQQTFWENSNKFVFKRTNKPKLSLFITIMISIGSIGSIATLFIKNSFFINLKENKTPDDSGKIIKELPYPYKNVPKSWTPLSTQQYNNIYNDLDNNEIDVSIIANNHIYNEKFIIHDTETLSDIIKRSKKFKIKIHYDFQLGDFLQSYKLLNKHSVWSHGTRKVRCYGDFYPMIIQNLHSASLGASNIHVKSKEIYQITYNG